MPKRIHHRIMMVHPFFAYIYHNTDEMQELLKIESMITQKEKENEPSLQKIPKFYFKVN